MGPGQILIGPLPPLLRDLVRRLAGAHAVGSAAPAPALTPERAVEALIDDAVHAGARTVVAAFTRVADAECASRLLTTRLPGAALIHLDERGRSATRYVAGVADAHVADLSPSGLRMLLGVGEPGP